MIFIFMKSENSRRSCIYISAPLLFFLSLIFFTDSLFKNHTLTYDVDNKCNKNSFLLSDSFETSALLTGNEKFTCIDWVIKNSDFNTKLDYTTILNKDIPILITSRKRTYSKYIKNKNKIFFRIIGGPANSIAPQKFDPIYSGLLDSEDVLLTMAYAGTVERSYYPKPMFQTACNELNEYILNLKTLNSKYEIIVLAESLGGALATCLVNQLKIKGISKIVLLSPLMTSPKNSLSYQKEIQSLLKASDRNSLMRVRTDGEKINSKRNWVYAPSAIVFHTFFDNATFDRVFINEINKMNNIPTLIIYGKLDDRIGIDQVPKLKKDFTVNSISDMGHFPNPQHEKKIFDLIRNFIK
jgi:hypothetical protein